MAKSFTLVAHLFRFLSPIAGPHIATDFKFFVRLENIPC